MKPSYNALVSGDIILRPIGTVHCPVREPADDCWGGMSSRIELDGGQFAPDCLAGLQEFSHIEVVFFFDRVAETEVHFGARRPRGRADWPMTGIFAQRGKDRPNRIGVTVCRLLAVDGLALVVEGLDAIDGTPVVDIKPYMREFGPKGPVRQPGWASELMAEYWGRSGL